MTDPRADLAAITERLEAIARALGDASTGGEARASLAEEAVALSARASELIGDLLRGTAREAQV